MVNPENEYFTFWETDSFPNGEEGETLVLDVKNGQGERISLKVKITRKEPYPNGYELDGVCVGSDGIKRTVTIVIYPNSPQNCGVRTSYDMARNT